ncbi:MAG: class I SAM-dependent methyltransferase [Akkermansiaceae bacterium]
MCSICKRLLAFGLAHSERAQHRFYGQRKRRLFSGIRGRVVEIGPGTGINFPYFSRDITWTGLEPNPHMHRYLHQAAEAHGIAAEILTARAEAMPLPDVSADAIVSTLVLCSVQDPDAVLREVRRVLRPGGRFYFIEHIAAPRGSLLRGVQRFVRPVWRVIADGCHPDRETDRLIAEKFDRPEIERFRVPLPVVTPHISGTASMDS